MEAPSLRTPSVVSKTAASFAPPEQQMQQQEEEQEGEQQEGLPQGYRRRKNPLLRGGAGLEPPLQGYHLQPIVGGGGGGLLSERGMVMAQGYHGRDGGLYRPGGEKLAQGYHPQGGGLIQGYGQQEELQREFAGQRLKEEGLQRGQGFRFQKEAMRPKAWPTEGLRQENLQQEALSYGYVPQSYDSSHYRVHVPSFRGSALSPAYNDNLAMAMPTKKRRAFIPYPDANSSRFKYVKLDSGREPGVIAARDPRYDQDASHALVGLYGESHDDKYVHRSMQAQTGRLLPSRTPFAPTSVQYNYHLVNRSSPYFAEHQFPSWFGGGTSKPWVWDQTAGLGDYVPKVAQNRVVQPQAAASDSHLAAAGSKIKVSDIKEKKSAFAEFDSSQKQSVAKWTQIPPSKESPTGSGP